MDYEFDLFLSYRRDPDLALAREVERFLEAFHRTPVDPKVGELRPLAVCVDGLDFHLPAPDAPGGAQARDVHAVLERYLPRCKELLVLCSAAAAKPSYLDHEVRWFLEHRGIDWIRLAFTEGEEPAASIDQYLAPSLRGRGIATNIAYDLRGYDARRSRSWRKVTPVQEELVRLACDVLGKPAGVIAPSFFRAELERVRTSSLQLASNARFESLLGDPARALLRAVRAHELHPSEHSERALKDAYRAAILHHVNRRASSLITGSGPSYLAGRWKQGEVFVETSPDGRWRALVTERGIDGGNPPGDVYLVSNETLRAIKLDAPHGAGGRVEDVAFSRDSQRLFVTRYFQVIVYALDGRVLGKATFQRWTKSPVPLVEGYVLGHFIAGADSKGGLWLVDPDDYNTYMELRSEWSRDAVVAMDISSDGACIAIVLESTKAQLLELALGTPPPIVTLAETGAMCARFLSPDVLVVGSEDGRIRRFERVDGTWRESIESDALPSQVEWVAQSDDGTLLAAVGTDRRIFVVDEATGALRQTLDYRHEVDWRSPLVVPFTGAKAWPGDPIRDSESIVWPNDTIAVERFDECGGERWLFTREQEGDNVRKRCYRLAHDAALHVDDSIVTVTQHGPITLLRSIYESQGRALWRNGEGVLHVVPQGSPSVYAAVEDGDTVWLATSKGAYTLRDSQFESATPPDWDVRDVRRVGGRLWLRTHNRGVFVADDGQLVRVTEGFVEIEKIVEAGGAVWLVRAITSFGGSAGGPAFRVDGWMVRELPRRAAVVGNVVDLDGAAWVSEEKCVYRVTENDTRRIDGLEKYVDAALASGTSVWVTTYGRGFMPSSGPAYRIEDGATTASPMHWSSTTLLATRSGPYATFFADNKSRCARLEPDGADEIDLGGGDLRGSAVIDEQLWLATSRGALWVSGREAVLVGPDRPVNSIQSTGDTLWLFGDDCVVKVEGERETTYPIADLKATHVVRAGANDWLITSTSKGWDWSFLFNTDDGTSSAGPALLVGRDGLTTVDGGGSGVRDVVHLGQETWLLTNIDGRVGPARRWRA